MTKKKAPLPTMEDIVSFLNENPGKVGKKEIARAFNIRGDDRIKLKEMLSEMKRSGQIEKSGLRGKKSLPPTDCPNCALVKSREPILTENWLQDR